eukprot:ANDGO_06719.mRNA.1 hypothetical protein
MIRRHLRSGAKSKPRIPKAHHQRHRAPSLLAKAYGQSRRGYDPRETDSGSAVQRYRKDFSQLMSGVRSTAIDDRYMQEGPQAVHDASRTTANTSADPQPDNGHASQACKMAV